MLLSSALVCRRQTAARLLSSLCDYPLHSGIIFDIKRYSINDGPGIRLTVFLKGCPLQCAWCHNPESISSQVEKMYAPDKCIGCNLCVEACPEQACRLTQQGIVTDSSLCNSCGICADVCPTMATEMSGRVIDIPSLLSLVEKERIFFDQSGGGVTFSGGEPLLQSTFLIAALDELGARSIHRSVDTTGFSRTDVLLEVAMRTDHFLYDLKHMDSKLHRKWTGVGNELILNNLTTLAATGASIEIRLPLVTGVNSDTENIKKTAAFVASLGGEKKRLAILPYHNIMTAKYAKLGRSFNPSEMTEPSAEELQTVMDIFASFGLQATVGG